jgi:hypothetical protein
MTSYVDILWCKMSHFALFDIIHILWFKKSYVAIASFSCRQLLCAPRFVDRNRTEAARLDPQRAGELAARVFQDLRPSLEGRLQIWDAIDESSTENRGRFFIITSIVGGNFVTWWWISTLGELKPIGMNLIPRRELGFWGWTLTQEWT